MSGLTITVIGRGGAVVLWGARDGDIQAGSPEDLGCDPPPKSPIRARMVKRIKAQKHAQASAMLERVADQKRKP